MSHYQRGSLRERQVKQLLEAEGWWVARAAGSKGEADLVALKDGERPRLLEIKSTVRPFSHFGPRDRADLKAAAETAGADPVLVWWPPRGRPQFLRADDWPPDRAVA